MQEPVERLASSLLYEGYALYPYTPGATKNATPTPFGIVYPPGYAASQPAAFDHLQVQCVVLTDPDEADPALEVTALFLHSAGSRHRASERRVELGGRLERLAGDGADERAFAFEPGSEAGVATGAALDAEGDLVGGRLTVAVDALAPGLSRLTARVENTTPLREADVESMDRGAALRRSLLSTHVAIELSAGRFASPLEDEGEVGAAVQACENVNTWPVLAGAADRAVLGAAILLPDHPEIAAQSRTNMFDNTEIEEALTLHVQTLSDPERESIAEQDPAVREMIERVDRTTPEELLDMHGEMRPSEAGLSGPARVPEWSEPAADRDASEPGRLAPQGLPPDDAPGESEVVVGGRAFRRGGKVVLRPGTDGDPYDKMLHGQEATIRRIYLDYDGRAYLGVTVDADPMSEVLRESGRFLFFFADELEALEEAR